MNIQRLCWRRSLGQSLSFNSRRKLSDQPKGLLELPQLLDPNDSPLIENGISGLYQPFGFKAAWTEWQGHMVNELNKRIAGRSYNTRGENLIRTLIFENARDQERAALFNYASMAYNNHFYFRGLDYFGSEPMSMPPSLENALLRDYSSIDNLKTQFLANAKAMFGPGFVWLVYTTNKYEVGTLRRFFILRTYLGGSPLAGAHFRRQEQDMNNSNHRSYARSLGQRAADGLVEVTPVLCVSTWQHSWMFDWTVAGKEQFLEAWWNKINWKVVSELADIDRIERNSQADIERKRRETMGLSSGLFDD